MLEINLLPVREARRKADLRQLMVQLGVALLISGAAVALVHSRISDDISSANKRVKQMESDIDQFKPQLEQVAKFRKQKKQLEKKIGAIETLDKARSGPVRMMSELAETAPPRLWLTSVKTSGRTVAIKGNSLDNEIVARFLRRLGDSKYFTNVELDSTQLGAQRGGLKVVQFDIRAALAGVKAHTPKGKKKKKKRKRA